MVNLSDFGIASPDGHNPVNPKVKGLDRNILRQLNID
jgi:hypothetical protein